MAELLAEGATLAAVVPPGPAVDAREVVLAVRVGAQQARLGGRLAEQAGLLGAAELQERWRNQTNKDNVKPAALERLCPPLRSAPVLSLTLRVAGRDLVGPVAMVGLRVEGQAVGAVEHVAPSRGAVHELAAVGRVAQRVVAVLVGAVLCGLGRLCNKSGVLHYDAPGPGEFLEGCSRAVYSRRADRVRHCTSLG